LSDFSSDSPACFYWLLAAVVVLSLIAPRQVRPELSPVSASQEAAGMFALAAGTHAEDGASGDAAADLAECGDTHFTDHPCEMDQILSLFFPYWRTDAARWGGVYRARASSDPVFPIDRPPKRAPRAA
jgi:hypothetical protein